MLVDEALRVMVGWIDAVWMPVVALLTLAAFIIVVRSVRRIVGGVASPGDRAAATALLAGVVGASALLFTPVVDGPYRCSPIAFGAEGRQTVRPDDRSGFPAASSDEAASRGGPSAAFERRQHVCDDAAKARGMTATAVAGGATLFGGGVALIFRPPRPRVPGRVPGGMTDQVAGSGGRSPVDTALSRPTTLSSSGPT
jgi:hypothetical protein